MTLLRAISAEVEGWSHVRSAWKHYALAVGAVALALLVRALLDPILDDFAPFVTVYTVLLPLVLLVRPGAFVVGAVFGLIGTWYLFVPPRMSFELATDNMAAQVSLFTLAVLMAAVPAWLASQWLRRQRMADELLRMAKSAAQLGLHAYDVATGTVDWDARTRELWGVGPEEPVMYDTWIGGVHEDDRRRVETSAARLCSTGGPQSFLEQYRVVNRQTGKVLWVEHTGMVRFAGGGPVQIVGTVRDITDRRSVEEERARHASEVEEALARRTHELTEAHEELRRSEAMAVLGTLSSGIAHDLGNILLPMEARLIAIKRADAPPEVREHIDGIEKNMQYIADLAKRLRHSIARVEPSQNHQSEPVNLGRWCDDANLFLRTLLPSHIDFECRTPKDVPMISVNRIGLTQAVYNLVQNAVKAMRTSNTGGRVIISAEPRQHGGAEEVEISIEDDGPGMPPEVLAHCLEPQFTTEAHRGAMGLGMTLVKSFVDTHGGELHIDSPPPGKPRGTRVSMTFAAVQATIDTSPSSPSALQPMESPKFEG